MPKVSIIIPTYNFGHLIVETLESVFKQTYKDFEVIVVDDGSTDDTHQKIKKYLPKIKYIKHNVNLGFAAAMNTGIRNAKGKYLNFLSSDDKVLPQFLEKEVEVLEKNPEVGLVFSPVFYIDELGKVIRKQKIANDSIIPQSQAYLKLIIRNYVNLVTALVRADIVRRVGFFNNKLRQNPDWDMWIRIASKSKLAYVPDYLGLYRRHNLSLTSEVKSDIRRIGPEKKIILEETIKDNVPKRLKPWLLLLFLDANIYRYRLPKPIKNLLIFIAFILSVATSRILGLVYA